MNCATTCNTGSCRGSRRSQCKRPVYRKKSHKEPHTEETDQIWLEAGFIPPPDCRRAVAQLHRLAMDEEPAVSLLSLILTIATRAGEGGRGYRILDPVKLRGMANDYGIECSERSDGEIAHAVTMAIIGEYWEKAPEEHA